MPLLALQRTNRFSRNFCKRIQNPNDRRLNVKIFKCLRVRDGLLKSQTVSTEGQKIASDSFAACSTVSVGLYTALPVMCVPYVNCSSVSTLACNTQKMLNMATMSASPTRICGFNVALA